MTSTKRELLCLADFEDHAEEHWPQNALSFYQTGADDNATTQDNKAAFHRYKIMPRLLRDVSMVDMTTSILGHPLAFPVCIAPTGYHRMAHPDGEIATAKAAKSMGTAMVLSLASTFSMEQVASESAGGVKYLQLYMLPERKDIMSLVKRAEAAGYQGLFVTVDSPTRGNQMIREGKLPENLKWANFETSDVTKEVQNDLAARSLPVFNPRLTWDDISWLKTATKLPIVLKGVISADDARLAVQRGVAGILVSHHGGRQLNQTPATIDVLSDVVRAVDGRCEVYLDGGVRWGTDVLKALALGARAVFVGRPVLYGLTHNGENGVRQVLQILKDELHNVMLLSGCCNLKSVDRGLVVHQSFFNSRL